MDRLRGRWAGRTYPFCCRALSAGRGAPKGRAVLLREALGAKVYRGGSAAGAMAWAETEPSGEGAEPGIEGTPPWRGRDSGAPAPPPHIWMRLGRRKRLGFQGAHLGTMNSAHGCGLKHSLAEAAWTDRQTCVVPGPCSSPQPTSQFPTFSMEQASALNSWPRMGVSRLCWGGQASQSNPTLPAGMAQEPGLPSAVCSAQSGPWRRTGKNEWARPKGAPTHQAGQSPTHLLRPRLRCSPQARILFWASMCVRPPAFSPSMLSTQSPTATPACAALPPGVSCGETEAHQGTRLQTKPKPTTVHLLCCSLPELRGIFMQHILGRC